MSGLSSLVGQVFAATNVSENGFIADESAYDQSGTITISAADFVGSDSDFGISDTQTVSAVDTTPTATAPLGTVTLVDTAPGGMQNAPLTYDVLGISTDGSMVLVGLPPSYDPGNGTGPIYSSYALLSNKDLSNDGAGLTFPLTFTDTDPNLYVPPCFAAGTRIATPSGEVAIEELAVGDLVRTVSGADRPIVWVGRRRVDIARHPSPEQVRPVRIAPHAFADGMPSRALVVSPDHNLHVEGVLIPAKCLVDGDAVRVLDVARVTWHHIELETHDVVLADGMPAETYLDTGNRAAFGGAGVTVAHPDFGTGPDLNWFAWDACGYAPLVLDGPELQRARATLARRSRTPLARAS